MKFSVIAIPRMMPSYHGIKDAPDIKEIDRKFVCAVNISGYPITKGKRDKNGRYNIIIRPGYRFDGASIPRFLWRLCGHPFQSPRDAAALVHDWLYSTHVFPRAIADSIYANAQWACGVPNWKVTLEQFALAIFGGRAWRRCDNSETSKAAWRHGDIELFFDGESRKHGRKNEQRRKEKRQ